MPTPTDLRAALRDLLTDRDEHDGDRLSRIEAGLRALADAPPTVAELLSDPGFLAGTHRIEGERRIQMIAARAVTVTPRGKEIMLWVPCPRDITAPARLVEVAP